MNRAALLLGLGALLWSGTADAQSLGQERAAQVFEAHPHERVLHQTYNEGTFREVAVWAAPTAEVHYAVIAARYVVEGRAYVAHTQLNYRYARPSFRVADPSFGPGLLRLHVRSEQDAAAEPASARTRRRGPERRYGQTKITLLAAHPERGLSVIRDVIERDNGVASASLDWDASASRLTVTTQRRNPPGRERCRRPRPHRAVWRWDGSVFVEVSSDPPSRPCH